MINPIHANLYAHPNISSRFTWKQLKIMLDTRGKHNLKYCGFGIAVTNVYNRYVNNHKFTICHSSDRLRYKMLPNRSDFLTEFGFKSTKVNNIYFDFGVGKNNIKMFLCKTYVENRDVREHYLKRAQTFSRTGEYLRIQEYRKKIRQS